MNLSQRNLCDQLYRLGLAANAPLAAELRADERNVVESVRWRAREELAALRFEPHEVDSIAKVVLLVDSGKGVRDAPSMCECRHADESEDY